MRPPNTPPNNARGNHQSGAAGEETLLPIPLLPDRTMDQNYELTAG